MIEASPTVWRRWLASELRRMRGEAGLEQKQVAQALRCTVTKVSYFENAQRTYEPQFVAGLLQTPGYTSALMRGGHAELGPDQIARSVELRTRRQVVVFRDANPLRCRVVLDEAALRRAAGGPRIMGAQIRHLVEAARRPNVTVQVLPFDRGAHPGIASGFTILTFPWPTDPGVVYVESGWSAGVYLEEPHEIEDHRQIFERLCALSLDPDASIGMLRDLAKEYAA